MANRAERRRQAKKSKQYDARKTFTKDEVETMNNAAYEYGLVFVLQAAARVPGIGDKRLEQIKQELLAVEFENGITRNDVPKWRNIDAETMKKGVVE